MYHHGEIYGYSIYTVSAIKLFLGNFTDDADKGTEAVITEKQKYSILTRTFDKDHNEVFTIYRGEVKDIATDAVRHDMGKEARMRCMIVKIDCSSKEASVLKTVSCSVCNCSGTFPQLVDSINTNNIIPIFVIFPFLIVFSIPSNSFFLINRFKFLFLLF